jgi:hypothetical protein
LQVGSQIIGTVLKTFQYHLVICKKPRRFLEVKEKTSQTLLPFEIFYLSLAPPLGALENCNLCHKMTISKSKSTCPRTLPQINDTKNPIPNFTLALYNKNLGETFLRCVMKIYEFESQYKSNAD